MTTTCSSSLTSFQGFHTSLVTNISSSPPIPSCSASSSCTLFLQFTISPAIFVDPHELPHYHHPVRAFNFTNRDAFDVEKPEHAIPRVGKDPEFVVEVGKMDGCDGEIRTSVDVPFHLRYPDPRCSVQGGMGSVVIDPPKAIWMCDGVASDSYACSPASLNATTVRVPLADTRQLRAIEAVTAMSTILGSIYILFIAYKTAIRLNKIGDEADRKKE